MQSEQHENEEVGQSYFYKFDPKLLFMTLIVLINEFMIEEASFGWTAEPFTIFGVFGLAVFLTLMTILFRGALHLTLIEREEACMLQSQSLVNRLACAIFQDESSQGPGWAVLQFDG